MSLDLFTVDLAQGIRSLMVSSVPGDDEWASEGELHLESNDIPNQVVIRYIYQMLLLQRVLRILSIQSRPILSPSL